MCSKLIHSSAMASLVSHNAAFELNTLVIMVCHHILTHILGYP